MATTISPDVCLSDIVLQYPAESLQVVPGLLATAVVLGLVLGTTAAVLICLYVLLPLLSKKVSRLEIKIKIELDAIKLQSFHVLENDTSQEWVGKLDGMVSKYRSDLIAFKNKKLNNVESDYRERRVYKWLYGKDELPYRRRRNLRSKNTLSIVDSSGGDSSGTETTSEVPALRENTQQIQSSSSFLGVSTRSNMKPPIHSTTKRNQKEGGHGGGGHKSKSETNKEETNIVFNLSSRPLSEAEINLLNRGLSFVPTPHVDTFERMVDVHRFQRQLKLRDHFREQEYSPEPFKKKSTYEPPHTHASIRNYTRILTQSVNEASNVAPYPNLTKGERDALIGLSNDRSVIVRPADKGGSIVVLDYTDYRQEDLRQLSDTTTYVKLKGNPTQPLADGASNPSLHENYKQACLPNQLFEDSACSSIESLSHGEKDDCSSTTTQSTTSEDRFYGRTIPRVKHFPGVLTCNSSDVKLCLYSLCLQSLPLLDTELRQEQHKMFLQILRINLTNLLLGKKIDGETYRKILSTQEAELEQLEAQYQSRINSTKLAQNQSSEFQTMEDIERREREYSEHLLQNIEGFWKQTEKVHQFLMDQAKCTYDDAMKLMMNLTSKMIMVEDILYDSQELQIMEIQEKMIRWEHMAKVVDSLKYQIQEESECRLNAVSKTLQKLNNNQKITVRQKERHLTELFKAFWEEVAQYNSDCLRQTKLLVSKHLENRVKLVESLRNMQKEEELTFLQKAQGTSDANSFIKEYHKLLEKQKEFSCDLEDEEDCKVIDDVADLSKDLYTGASQRFEHLVKTLFLQTLPGITNLSLEECENLKQELRHNLSVELEKAENERKARIKIFQESLLEEKQLWAKEHALSSTLHNYASEKQQQIIQEVLMRLGGLNEESNKMICQRHKFFLQSVLRSLALRNIAVATLTRMRISRKKIHLQELKEQHTLEKSKWPCQDEGQWQIQNDMETHILEEERKLESDTHHARTDFQQQLLADLIEATNAIRQHMEQLTGQALIQHAQQEAAKGMAEGPPEFKERLLEAAVESVYVTGNGVNQLVQNYNQNIKNTLKHFEAEKCRQLQEITDNTKIFKQRKKQELQTAPAKQKLTKQPSRSDLHKRLFLHQQQLQKKFMVYEQIRLESLKQKKSVLHQMKAQLEDRLKDAEQDFIAELAAMARIRITDGTNAANTQSEPITKKHPQRN
ncbi:evC complex member EVC [Bombina bombina]|uniref:evC complex member EVC n=1 Tax=Bombina bombina TaxID=8345 RepID=UPI00235AFB9A|nr:evC complex member EVC [Bombina bombina]